MKFEFVKASCKGTSPHHNQFQDYVAVKDDHDLLVATVSDGLGSARQSAVGAISACNLVISCLAKWDKFKSLQSYLRENVIERWRYMLSCDSGFRVSDYSTTSSFVFVDKRSKDVYIGRIGDSMIICFIDGILYVSESEKEFLNETECLGENSETEYECQHFRFSNSFSFLLGSDGFMDEVDCTRWRDIMSYFNNKYKKIAKKHREYELKKEIKSLKNKNGDDKSLIIGWYE